MTLQQAQESAGPRQEASPPDSSPLYMQIARKLTDDVRAGRYQVDQALPSERTLSEQLNVSRVTARKAIDQLVEQGAHARRMQLTLTLGNATDLVIVSATSVRPTEHYPPEGKLRVYRSRSGGNEWEALTNGLPQHDCYVNILRDAMGVDQLDPCGVYFGTTGGQVYGSPNGGDSWTPIVRDLPSVLSVEVQTL